MCFGGGGGDGGSAAAAAETKALEEKRQADIRAGVEHIDTAFSPFDEPYYGSYQNAFLENYNPDIDDQYKEARGTLAAALAGRGMLESSMGINKLGDLEEKRNDTRIDVANRSVDAGNDLRAKVEKTKTDLFSLNQASADPQGISARAKGEATALVAPSAYSPLGDIFAAALSPFANYVSADRNSTSPTLAFNRPHSYNYGSNSGSGSIVN